MSPTKVELGLSIPGAILSFFVLIAVCRQSQIFNKRRKERHQSFVKRHPKATLWLNGIIVFYLTTSRIIDGPWLKSTKESNEVAPSLKKSWFLEICVKNKRTFETITFSDEYANSWRLWSISFAILPPYGRCYVSYAAYMPSFFLKKEIVFSRFSLPQIPSLQT